MWKACQLTDALTSELVASGGEAFLNGLTTQPLLELAQETGVDDFDVIALKFADGTVWACTSTSRDSAEGEEFMDALHCRSSVGDP